MNRERRSLCRSKTLGGQFWEDRFEASDDETLVDRKVLSYAYLEVGVIEATGSRECLYVVFSRLRR
jgi:hypothetical protein